VENANSLPDISSIMNLVKLFAPSSSPSQSSNSEQKSWPMFPLDSKIHTEPLRVCKCLIPYLPFEKQRDLSIVIKIFELMAVTDYFAGFDPGDIVLVNATRSETWETDLLTSIRSNLEPQNAYWVDIFFKINDVKDILANAKPGLPPPKETSQIPPERPNPSNAAPSKDFMDNIAPSLNDSQKDLLKMLSTVMK